MKKFLIILFVSFVVFVIVFYSYKQFYFSESSAGVFFLNVGQGDASLIRTRNGLNVLIDGGPDNKILYELSKVLPWWDREIDLVILTHPHDDHIAGLIEIFKKYQVDLVLETGVDYDSPAYGYWQKEIKSENIKDRLVNGLEKIVLDKDCNLQIVFPRANISGQVIANLNNYSIVSLLDCYDKRILYMGDAEKEVEEELLKSGFDLQADIIKVGHHGSETASTEEFLHKVNPKTAIVSVGADNSFGLPDLSIIRRLERLGIMIRRTDWEGTIRFNF